jgi:type II secretory pathway predicted ATPase ExeA/cell division protein FtsN
MDASAFGLSRNPFQRSPELDEACLPNTIAALLSELQAGLRSPQGVSVLVGEAGSGKTMAASAFARRLVSVAQTAVLLHPTSSVGAIARDALAQLGGADADAVRDDNWVEALMVGAHRRARSGKSTVLLLDDAHRLSPQTLEDLAELFDDDAPASLHLFLFGRPRLLDRMHAGPEKALHAHLLQVGRLEPLGLRECVRYLERRVALCGGELAAMFDEGAIDELIRISEGRLVLLEQNALAALERATKRRVPRAQPEDVRPVARVAADEEEEVMAARQQPLRFELPDDSGEEEAEWQTGDAFEDEEDDEWGHDAEAGEEEWHADDRAEDESFDDPSLSWENAGPTLDDREEEADDDDAFARPTVPPPVDGRNRLMGRAVLSVAACLGLVWAANNLPGPDTDADRGRDSKLFAERLSSRPEDILRLARTTEAADADAQLKAWLAQPKPARAAEPVAAAKPAVPAVPATGAFTAVAGKEEPMGPDAPVVVAADAPRTETPARSAVAASAKPVAVASNKAPSKPAPATAKASAKPSAKSPVKAAAKAPAGPVYTVQLGAFKARSNAEQFATKLRGKPSRIVRHGSLYRVVSGSFSSKREATVPEASRKRAGFTTYVTTAVF